MKELMFLKKLTLTKQMRQNNVCFVIIGILKMFVISLNHTFVANSKYYDVLITAYELQY